MWLTGNTLLCPNPFSSLTASAEDASNKTLENTFYIRKKSFSLLEETLQKRPFPRCLQIRKAHYLIYKRIQRVTRKEKIKKKLKCLRLSIHRGEAFSWMTAAQVYKHTSIGFPSADPPECGSESINRGSLTSACGGICRLGSSAKRLKLN